MAFNLKKFFNALKIVPKASSTIDVLGEFEVLSSTNKAQFHNGTSASPLVTESHTATLTNKTISGASNTITNVSRASLNAGNPNAIAYNNGAGILTDSTNLIYDGNEINITSALGGIGINTTSSAVNIMNVRRDQNTLTRSILRNTHSGASAQVQFSLSSDAGDVNLSALSISAGAVASLTSDPGFTNGFLIGTNTGPLDLRTGAITGIFLSGAGAVTLGRTGASLTGIFNGNAFQMLASTASTNFDITRGVNTASISLSGDTGISAGAGVKFFGGAHATDPNLTQFFNNSVQTLSISATGALNIGPGGASVSHQINGNQLNLVHSSSTGIFAINRDTSVGGLALSGGTSPSNGGRINLYGPTHATKPKYVELVSNDVTFRMPLADGAPSQVLQTDGAGNLSFGVASSGFGVNYIANPDAEVNTNGWATYADVAGVAPVDGTGGSPSVTLSRITASPLRGIGMFRLSKDGANRQGQGASYNFTIADADKAKPLSISFEYQPSAGFVAGDASDIRMYIYDVTNALVIQLAPYTIQGGSGATQKFIGTFQTSSNSTSYRLIFHIATTNTVAWDFNFDTVVVGPQILNYGAPISDWNVFTPTGSWVANTTYSGEWRRVGDSMQIRYRVGTTGAPTATVLFLNLPPGYSIDTSKIATDLVQEVGNVAISDNDVLAYAGPVFYDTTTRVRPNYLNGSVTGQTVSQTTPFTWNNGDYLTASILVPIQGWGSNVVMSNDTDTRVVALTAPEQLPTGTLSAVQNVVVFGTISKDTHGAYNTSTGIYTVPVSGYYKVSASLDIQASGVSVGNASTVSIYKNGVQALHSGAYIYNASVNELNPKINGTIFCNAGDTLAIFSFTNTTGNAFINNVGSNFLSIERVSGPSAIAASETVTARYMSGVAQAINSTPSILDYATKDFDSHNAVTTGASWKFTAPVAGIYNVSAQFEEASTSLITQIIALYKNGSIFSVYRTARQATNSAAETPVMNTTIRLLAGDFIDIRKVTNGTASTTPDTQANFVCITKVGNY